MALLTEDIVAFDRMKADLEAEHFGDWVLFKDGVLVRTFSTFEEAASEAVDRFERGPYLIRQVGASAVNLPAAVMFRPAHAPDASGV